jgi:WD40 repeat protein
MSRLTAYVLLVAGVAAPWTLPGPPARPLDRLGDPLPPGAVARLGTVRLRHSAGITALAFSPDGKVLATGSHDQTLRLWEVRTAREIRRLPEIKGQVYTLAFSPDGRLLAASGGHNTIHLWDTGSGREVHRLHGHTSGVYSLAFAPDGKMLASAAGDKTARLWEVATGKLRHLLGAPHDPLTWVAFFPDGKTLATCGRDAVVIRYWDVASGRLLERQAPETGAAQPVALMPDGKSVLTVNDRRIQLWDLAAGKQTGTFKGTQPALTRDGKALASLDQGQVRLWDMARGTEIRRFPVGQSAACAAAFAPDGKSLALTGSAVRLWDVTTGKQILPFGPDPGALAALALSADGRTALTVCDGGRVHLWDVATGMARGHAERLTTGGYCLAVSPDGRTFAAETGGGSAIALGDLKGQRSVRTLRGHQEQIGGLAFSPDGQTLASVGNRVLVLWDVASGKEMRRIAERSAYRPLTFAPDGKGVFTQAHGGTAALWDLDTGQKVRTFREPHQGEFVPSIIALAPSPDGRLLAQTFSGHLEGFLIELYEVATGRLVQVFGGHTNMVFAVAFSPDGRLLASCSDDGTVRLWDVLSGKERQRFTGHRGRVYQVAYAPDGRRVVSRGADGTGLVWDVSALHKPPVGIALPQGVLQRCWADLGASDAGVAYKAVARLAEAPRAAVALLKGQMRPVTAAPAARVAALIRDLDNPRFAVRQAAMKELDKLGDLAEPSLRAVLAGKPSLETRHRVEQVLQRGVDIPAGQLQGWRALAVLEYLGSPDARGVLETVAAGAPEARITREARAALHRLSKRTMKATQH